MVITLDGPAGSGKSSVAQEVARRLEFAFLNTGHMYRALGLAAHRQEVDLHNHRELAAIAKRAKIMFDYTSSPPAVILNGEPVTHLLGSREASDAASYIAVVPQVRELMVQQQRKIGEQLGNVVTEGRDQGTIVFPHAEYKFYIDASPEERTRRRVQQLRSRGEQVDARDVFEQITARDKRDRERLVGPLEKPKDAIEIISTLMSFEDVVYKIMSIIKADRL
jgi:CMP/dCMP kinase